MDTKHKHAPIKLDTAKSWLVVMSSSLLFFYTFFILNILSTISKEVMATFQIGPTEMGFMSSMYFYSNFILLFPGGLLLDRLSTKKIVLFAMACGVIGLFGFAYSTDIYVASTFRFLSGISGSFCLTANVRLASKWFSTHRLALVIGVIITFAMLGGFLAQAPAAYLTKLHGWRMMMTIFSILGVVFWVWMSIFIKDWPKHWEEKEQAEEVEHLGFKTSIKKVLKNRFNWLGGIYTSFINLPIFILGALWGFRYLTDALKFSEQEASYINSLLFLGAILGGPAIGWLSDKIERRKIPMIIGAILSFIVVMMIIYAPMANFVYLGTLFFLLGFLSSSQSLGYPIVCELNSPLFTATANSIVSGLVVAGGFVFQPLFGWLMQITMSTSVDLATAIFSLADFQRAMTVLPVAFVISIICSFFLRETYCKYIYK